MQLTLVLPSSHPAMVKNRALHSEGHLPLQRPELHCVGTGGRLL